MSRKRKGGVVYSTNPDYEYYQEEETVTLSPDSQKLRVYIDTKHRKGKVVTVVEGFVGTDYDCKELAKTIKVKCGVGGSSKNNLIIIQGNLKQKIVEILKKLNYNVR